MFNQWPSNKIDEKLFVTNGHDRNFKWEPQWPPVQNSEGQKGETGGHNIQEANTHSEPFCYQKKKRKKCFIFP